jgi:hypothetical protein
LLLSGDVIAALSAEVNISLQQTEQTAPIWRGFLNKAQRFRPRRAGKSALAGLETRVALIDDVKTPLAANDPAFLVPILHRLKRIDYFHDSLPPLRRSLKQVARNIRARTPVVKGDVAGY